jgi:hypothetical protein
MISMDHHCQTLLEVRSIKRSSHNKLFSVPPQALFVELHIQNFIKCSKHRESHLPGISGTTWRGFPSFPHRDFPQGQAAELVP